MALQAVKHFRHRQVYAALKAASSAPSPSLASPSSPSPSTPSTTSPTQQQGKSQGYGLKVANPFLPRLNPTTGRWAPPAYSLRRQAELVKKARASGTLHLLPAGPKLSSGELRGAIAKAQAEQVQPEVLQTEAQASEEVTEGQNAEKKVGKKETDERWLQPLEWEGEPREKVVPGADVGNRLYAGKWRMFKGHKWQRVAEQRKEAKEKALKVMGRRVKWFKGVRAVFLCVRWWVCADGVLFLWCADVQAQEAKPARPTEGDCETWEAAVLIVKLGLLEHVPCYSTLPYCIFVYSKHSVRVLLLREASHAGIV